MAPATTTTAKGDRVDADASSSRDGAGSAPFTTRASDPRAVTHRAVTHRPPGRAPSRRQKLGGHGGGALEGVPRRMRRVLWLDPRGDGRRFVRLDVSLEGAAMARRCNGRERRERGVGGGRSDHARGGRRRRSVQPVQLRRGRRGGQGVGVAGGDSPTVVSHRAVVSVVATRHTARSGHCVRHASPDAARAPNAESVKSHTYPAAGCLPASSGRSHRAWGPVVGTEVLVEWRGSRAGRERRAVDAEDYVAGWSITPRASLC